VGLLFGIFFGIFIAARTTEGRKGIGKDGTNPSEILVERGCVVKQEYTILQIGAEDVQRNAFEHRRRQQLSFVVLIFSKLSRNPNPPTCL
jgi:hypothetical protein